MQIYALDAPTTGGEPPDDLGPPSTLNGFASNMGENNDAPSPGGNCIADNRIPCDGMGLGGADESVFDLCNATNHAAILPSPNPGLLPDGSAPNMGGSNDTFEPDGNCIANECRLCDGTGLDSVDDSHCCLCYDTAHAATSLPTRRRSLVSRRRVQHRWKRRTTASGE